MPASRSVSSVLLAALLATPMAALPAQADEPALLEFARPGGGPGGGGDTTSGPYYGWMSPEITTAWDRNLRGQGTTITVVDDFSSSRLLSGNLGDGPQYLRHGEWTRKEAGMLALDSTMVAHDHTTAAGQAFVEAAGFDVLNLSYGYIGKPGEAITDTLQSSIVTAARDNSAFVSKAAGNQYGLAVGAVDGAGNMDILSRDLIGAPGAVFVGALDRNGTTKRPARLANYSNVAGASATVQEQFLVVGVEGGLTGLAGTSFAAPIVSGYAAVLESKFGTDSPALIADRLLDTARTDRIFGYRPNLHGQGEASIANAIAPDWVR